jgi:O-acetyl-ADP-ribose deacetylase (regulator of RNase III)
MSVTVTEGDLTAQDVDAIVNAANEHLAHGGGVAAAIVRAGGRVIQEESTAWVRKHGPVPEGTAVVTTGGALLARWVIHVVGPRHRPAQDNEGLLRRAVEAALEAGAREGARSIAFPAISSGIFGYPTAEATAVIARTCSNWLGEHPGSFDEIRLVGFDRAVAAGFEAGLAPGPT